MTAPPDVVDVVEDRIAWPVLIQLADCLCTELVTAGLPPTCICAPFPGEAVATDYVNQDQGMAWVRLASMFPSSAFPAQDGTASGCLMPMAAQLEVGVLYCAPVTQGRSNRTPPGLSAMFDSTRLQMAAMAAMLRAIECCLGAANRKSVALGAYAPLGPDGGVVGGTWTVTVAEGVLR